jgi:L-2,4-diaminobutyric acid acetyltransferase
MSAVRAGPVDVLLCEPGTTDTEVRNVRPSDAAEMWRLVRRSEALDLNSPYAYLLLCRHHGRTCLVAEEEDRLVGFVTAYVPPAEPDVVFVWQIAVAASHRRRGLARRLIQQLLDRCPEARFVECTVTPSNAASLRLFRDLAAARGAEFSLTPGFAVGDFPPESPAHEQEDVVRIGPFDGGRSDDPSPERNA